LKIFEKSTFSPSAERDFVLRDHQKNPIFGAKISKTHFYEISIFFSNFGALLRFISISNHQNRPQDRGETTKKLATHKICFTPPPAGFRLNHKVQLESLMGV
jgi:hypothetical protein